MYGGRRTCPGRSRRAGEADDVAGQRLGPSDRTPPADRCEPSRRGSGNPAMPSTKAVSPEQSNPISVPQLLNSPPPRAQPLFGPAPGPAAAPHVGQAQRGEPGGQTRRPPRRSARVIVWPASAADTNWLLGIVTVVPVASTAG